MPWFLFCYNLYEEVEGNSILTIEYDEQMLWHVLRDCLNLQYEFFLW